MRSKATRWIGSVLVLCGVGAVAAAQSVGGGGGVWRSCSVSCAECGDMPLMNFNCHVSKHCCTIVDCGTCSAAGVCCPNIPTVCCIRGYTSVGSPVAECSDCDPV